MGYSLRLPIYVWPIYTGEITPFETGSGAHLLRRLTWGERAFGGYSTTRFPMETWPVPVARKTTVGGFMFF